MAEFKELIERLLEAKLNEQSKMTVEEHNLSAFQDWTATMKAMNAAIEHLQRRKFNVEKFQSFGPVMSAEQINFAVGECCAITCLAEKIYNCMRGVRTTFSGASQCELGRIIEQFKPEMVRGNVQGPIPDKDAEEQKEKNPFYNLQ